MTSGSLSLSFDHESVHPSVRNNRRIINHKKRTTFCGSLASCIRYTLLVSKLVSNG